MGRKFQYHIYQEVLVYKETVNFLREHATDEIFEKARTGKYGSISMVDHANAPFRMPVLLDNILCYLQKFTLES